MYVSQHIQELIALVAVGVTLAGYGTHWAAKIAGGQAATNAHLVALNGSIARHETLIGDNTQAIADTLLRIDACRQRQDDRAEREMVEFRKAVQEDVQSVLDRWNVKHHDATGA